MKKNKLVFNTSSSLLLQITTVLCGFILPKLLLSYFGSEINGLVTSVTQFLQMIALLELGVGSVVQSELYKPLAEKNDTKTSEIVSSANKFFKTLAYILIVYVIVLIIIYPIVVNSSFDFIFTATLILAMSISSFSQYYIGVVDRLLLTADQRGYIQYNAQTITLILNMIATIILIKLGGSIQVVKLTTSIIYLVRPFFLRWYVNKHYNINRKIKYEEEPIKQKWNGVAQHIAAMILDGTDVIVLTLFSSLADVSVYSIYYMVVNGVKQLSISLTHGIQALLGELWAKQDLEKLNETFSWTEWIIHTGTVFLFGCTATLIVPFVQVYTNGVNDVNYIRPIFALLLTTAYACHCLRLPYNLMILASGHYKQTQRCHIIAALINLCVSILTVKHYGLIGVAIGTFAALIYQTIWMAYYSSKNLVRWPFTRFFKQILVDIIIVLVSFVMIKMLGTLSCISLIEWIILACKCVIIWFISILGINLVFYRSNIIRIIKKIT